MILEYTFEDLEKKKTKRGKNNFFVFFMFRILRFYHEETQTKPQPQAVYADSQLLCDLVDIDVVSLPSVAFEEMIKVHVHR